MIDRIRITALCVTFAVALGWTHMTLASEYPTKPLNMIIQFPAGSTTDILGRKVAAKISDYLGQTVVAINKPGGGGAIGVAEVARSKPDGYTFGLATTPTITIIPQLQDLPYKPFEDITQICSIYPVDYGLYVRGDAPWKTWEELVEYARANKGKWRHAFGGSGTTDHIVSVRIAQKLKLDAKLVPYRGHVDCIAPVLGGHVESAIGSPAVTMSHIKAGKLRMLLITGRDRWPVLPDVPAMLEKGFDFWQTSYISVIVPAKTPKEIQIKLAGLFQKATEDQQLKKELEEEVFIRLSYMSGEKYTKFLKEQSVFYKDYLKTLDMGSK